MPHTSPPSKPKSAKHNTLSIRLVESAVYLRTDGSPSRRSRSARETEPRTAQLRGLLVLDLVKPTKITSIDVELIATTNTAWPEGIGARRIEVSEEHRVFHASTTYFQANKSHNPRRAVSVGPGISYYQQDDLAETDADWEDPADQDDSRRDQQHSSSAFRSSSIVRSNSDNGPHNFPHNHPSQPRPGPSRLNAQLPSYTSSRSNRRVSFDSTHFQRLPVSEAYHMANEHTVIEDEDHRSTPIPPYSPSATSPFASFLNSATLPGTGVRSSSVDLRNVGTGNDTTQTLGDLRNSLQSSLRQYPLQSPPDFSPSSSSSLSLQSTRQADGSPSRHASTSAITTHVILEDEQLATSPISSANNERLPVIAPPHTSSTPRTHSATRSPSAPHSRSQSRNQTQNTGQGPIPPHSSGHLSPSVAEATNSERQGRKGSRFSLSAMSNALKDAVRANSPRRSNRHAGQSRERDRELSVDEHGHGHHFLRGRTMERAFVEQGGSGEDGEEKQASRERGGGVGVIGRLLGETADGWKEFKKGTYTYPIAFSIPGNAPPTMVCDYGTVSWRLKANVHRPGTFKAKLTAVRDVVTVVCPTEEDTEDTENIIVERQWDGQLQYLISISGRSFCIGGTLPISFTLMPLAKIKVHRIAVFIEERVDYYTNMRRIARSDPVTRFPLLSARGEGKGSDPILPLESDDVEAFRNSPLFQLMSPDDDISEMASTLMGPGPWTFHSNLKLPSSCHALKFTNRNRRSNIIVSHVFKLVMRVERGDDLHIDGKTGKRKLFDIVVQTPVLILSCRCNPEWATLPRYSEAFDEVDNITPTCPCQASRAANQGIIERITSRHSSSSSTASAAETQPVHPNSGRSLRHSSMTESIMFSNDLFERLVSGQETESGESPPAYDPGPSIARVNGIAVQ